MIDSEGCGLIQKAVDGQDLSAKIRESFARFDHDHSGTIDIHVGLGPGGGRGHVGRGKGKGWVGGREEGGKGGGGRRYPASKAQRSFPSRGRTRFDIPLGSDGARAPGGAGGRGGGGGGAGICRLANDIAPVVLGSRLGQSVD